MNLSTFVKQLVPPLIRALYHNYANGLKSLYVWKGVYASFEQVPTRGSGYYGQRLAQETASLTQMQWVKTKGQKRIPFHISDENSLLPLILAVLQKNNGKISILDLGGGMGIGYISLLSCLEHTDQLSYFVIETPAMCEGGSRIFADDSRITFLSDFPTTLPPINLVYMNSALQYFENYRDVLKRLAAYSPEYFLFVKCSAGHIPTYATVQRNLGGTESAYWFFNVEEIIDLMARLGYTVIYKSALSRLYDQDNFSENHRLHQACNLLFSKTA